jgi:hypothetical protein
MLYMAKIYDNNNNEMLKKQIGTVEGIAKDVNADIPSGYISIELSTHGLLGAPKRFHTRNFDTADLLNLALSEEEDLPEKVAKMLDNLILEKDVSVMNFHEKEVIEYLVRLYQAFYSNTLKEAEFPWNEKDIEFLKDKYGNTTEYERNVFDLRNRKWIPKTTIDLSVVETYDLDPDTFHTNIYLTDKQSGFAAGFSFPRHGDIVVLRNFVIKEFRDRDKQYASVKDVLKFRRDAEDRIRRGEDIQLSRLPNIPEIERDKYRQYEIEKSIFSVTAIKALHLTMYDGKDISNVPLIERLELAKDPRIDYKMMKAVTGFFEKMTVGIKEDTRMFNPIKGIEEVRRYTFRLVDLLQAIKLYEPTQYDVVFEPPHIK